VWGPPTAEGFFKGRWFELYKVLYDSVNMVFLENEVHRSIKNCKKGKKIMSEKQLLTSQKYLMSLTLHKYQFFIVVLKMKSMISLRTIWDLRALKCYSVVIHVCIEKNLGLKDIFFTAFGSIMFAFSGASTFPTIQVIHKHLYIADS
jgi:hypothetical protein